MPRPRHSHRDHRFSPRLRGLLTAIAVTTVVVSGCYQQPEPPRHFVPGDPLYEQFTSPGDRLVVASDDDALALKIRRRRHISRVFDSEMRPVGQVRVDGDRVERRTLDGSQRTTAEWIDDDTAEISGAWRLERTDEGWDVFDADATVVALLRRPDDRWTLRPTRGDIATFVIDVDDDAARVVDSDGDPVVETGADDFGELPLLILAIDELPPLDRYSLAAWADLHL